MKTKLLLVALLFFLSQKIFSQAPDWLWAGGIGGYEWEDKCNSITTDAGGNLYATGTFYGTVDFDPGAGSWLMSTQLSSGNIFIAKYNSTGTIAWATALSGNGNSEGFSIAVDDSGYIYVTGSFQGTVDFNPGVGVYNLNSTGYSNMFVVKLDSSRNFVWARSVGGPVADEIGFSIAPDNSGNVYVTGTFQGTVDFDPGNGTFSLAADSVRDVFILKLNRAGDFQWAKGLGGNSGDVGKTIIPDDIGNVYVAGDFQDTVDFDPGAGVFNLISSDISIFILKLDSSGNFTWAKTTSGGATYFGSMVRDYSGNIYTTGFWGGIVDFDPGAGTYNLLSTGITNLFISKLDSSGGFLWTKVMGGEFQCRGFSIAVDDLQNVYTTGYFSDTVDFDPGSGVYDLIATNYENIFISKLDISGNFAWASTIHNSNQGYSIIVDSSNYLYLTGTYGGSATFGSTTIISNVPYADFFIAKLDATTGIESINNNNAVSIFPNPASNHFTIALGNHKKVEVTISDITGKIIYSTAARGTDQIEISTKDFSEGVYIVRVKGEEFVETKKILITNQY